MPNINETAEICEISLDSEKDLASIQFTEEMHGFVSVQDDEIKNFGSVTSEVYEQCAENGRVKNNILKFKLTICVPDLDSFLNDPKLQALATGEVHCSLLGGVFPVSQGSFNLFLRPTNSPDFDAAKEMHYLLHFQDRDQQDWTFYGYKVIRKGDGLNGWKQTTTLYTRLFKGQLTKIDDSMMPWAQGILTLNINDFIKQLGTMSSDGKSLMQRMLATSKFVEVFAENLWEAYAPAIFNTDTSRWKEHIYPVNTLEGVKNAEVQTHSFNTGDGLTLNLTRFTRRKCKDVVVLLHGLTTSTDMFIMPEHYNLTQYLLDNGYSDVFSLDWRGSNRFIYNLKVHRYTLDDLALYDMPAAIEKVRAIAGEDCRIHVIAHCVGSIGMMTSLAAGLTKGVTSVVSNSVSLNPRIHWQAKLKLAVAPWLVDNILAYPYLSPEISYLPGFRFIKLISFLEKLIHRECKESACHMVSFLWGWGFPAAYEHENIHPLTHRRLKDLFGGTSMNYFRHINKMVNAQEAVTYNQTGVYAQLPKSYFEHLSQVKLPPTLFISGDQNNIFPGSNKTTYDRIKSHFPDLDVQFQWIRNYGHQDVFMGKNCAIDVFPTLLNFLNQHK